MRSLEWLVAPQCFNRKQMTVFPQRKEWVTRVFVSSDILLAHSLRPCAGVLKQTLHELPG